MQGKSPSKYETDEITQSLLLHCLTLQESEGTNYSRR